VLPRSRLLFTRIDLNGIPARRQREAVRLELEQKAPFDAGGWMLRLGGQACVWYWPRALEQPAAPADAPGSRPAMVPESALWPALGEDEFRWLAEPSEDLYLLQYRHPQRGLYEKRYTAPVDAGEALAWLQRHGARIDHPGALQPAAPPPVTSYQAPAGESLDPQTSYLEQRVFPATAALLLFLVAVYSVAVARAGWETGQARAERRAVQAQVQDVIDLRNRAGELRAGNRRLAAIARPSQLALAALLAETLDISSTRLVQWSYRDDRLDLSWQSDGMPPDATRLIPLLEAEPALRNVQAQVHENGLVQISLNIVTEALREATPPAVSKEDEPPPGGAGA